MSNPFDQIKEIVIKNPEDTVSGGLDFAEWIDDTYCYEPILQPMKDNPKRF